jgi:alpha-L-fucosidase
MSGVIQKIKTGVAGVKPLFGREILYSNKGQCMYVSRFVNKDNATFHHYLNRFLKKEFGDKVQLDKGMTQAEIDKIENSRSE